MEEVAALKFAVNLSLFPKETPFEERLRLAAQAGCDGVEVNIEGDGEPRLDAKDKELEEIKRRAAGLGLEIPSVHCGLHWRYTLTDPDPAVRQKGIDVLGRSLEIGAALGARLLLVVPGLVQQDVAYDDAYRRALDGVRALAEKAAATGVAIGVENVWNKFLLSPLEMRRFIEEVESPWVGAYFDVGNILAYGFPHHWIKILGGLIKAVHVKDYRLDVPGLGGFVYLGQGDVPWKRVQEALAAVGYDGYVTAELPPYRYGGEATVFDVVASMRRVMGA